MCYLKSESRLNCISLAEFISCVTNFVFITILVTKSISIHSDFPGVHFWYVPFVLPILINELMNIQICYELQKPIRMLLILSGITFCKLMISKATSFNKRLWFYSRLSRLNLREKKKNPRRKYYKCLCEFISSLKIAIHTSCTLSNQRTVA